MMYDDAENAFRWVYLGIFFWIGKKSWNTAIAITLSEPIIDDNLEVDVPENFLMLKIFPLYLKPSGPTDYFEIPT